MVDNNTNNNSYTPVDQLQCDITTNGIDKFDNTTQIQEINNIFNDINNNNDNLNSLYPNSTQYQNNDEDDIIDTISITENDKRMVTEIENSDDSDDCDPYNNTIHTLRSISGKIFVGGLLKTTSNESLKHYFTEFGLVRESIVIKANERSIKSRGFGFVTFADPMVIDEIINENHEIEGKRVEIRRAIPKEDMIDEPKKQKLFVGGLPKNITLDDFSNYFSAYGELLELNLLTEKSGTYKGFGFVCFKDESINDIILNSQHQILEKRIDIRIADSQNRRPYHSGGSYGGHHHNHNQKTQSIFSVLNGGIQNNNNNHHDGIISSGSVYQSQNQTNNNNNHHIYPISNQQKPVIIVQAPIIHQNNNSNFHLFNLNQPHQQSLSQAQIDTIDGVSTTNTSNSLQLINSDRSNNRLSPPNSSSSENQITTITSQPLFNHGNSDSGVYEIYHQNGGLHHFSCGGDAHHYANSTYYHQNYMMVPVLYPYPYHHMDQTLHPHLQPNHHINHPNIINNTHPSNIIHPQHSKYYNQPQTQQHNNNQHQSNKYSYNNNSTVNYNYQTSSPPSSQYPSTQFTYKSSNYTNTYSNRYYSQNHTPQVFPQYSAPATTQPHPSRQTYTQYQTYNELQQQHTTPTQPQYSYPRRYQQNHNLNKSNDNNNNTYSNNNNHHHNSNIEEFPSDDQEQQTTSDSSNNDEQQSQSQQQYNSISPSSSYSSPSLSPPLNKQSDSTQQQPTTYQFHHHYTASSSSRRFNLKKDNEPQSNETSSTLSSSSQK